MKRLMFLAAAVLMTLSIAWAQPGFDPNALSNYAQGKLEESRQLIRDKDYDRAAAVLDSLRKIPGLDVLGNEWTGLLYNMACGYSLAGHTTEALECLSDAIDAGWANAEHMGKDTDLDNIRQEPAFAELVERCRREQVFWENPIFKSPYRPDLNDDEKIAGLSRLWMEAKYNFAFFDQVPELNWDSLYIAYLPRVRATHGTHEYYLVLQSFYAYLKDGHTGVIMPPELSDSINAYAAMATRLIEDRVIIVRVLSDSLREMGLKPGVEITAVDGIPVHQFVDSTIMPYLSSSTPQDLMLKAYGYAFLSGYEGQQVTLDLRDLRGRAFKRVLTLGFPGFAGHPNVEYKRMKGNVAYVALNTFGDNHVTAVFDSLYPQIETSDALILDVRRNGGGSSNIGWTILDYLTDQPFLSTQWKTRDYKPAYRAWGGGTTWYHGTAWEIQPHGSEPYAKPVVVLTAAQTGSAAEDFCAVFDAMKRGTIIGEPTGGSTGQPLLFSLPGNGSARVCTKHDSYADGTEFVGIGILPDVTVHPTLKDIRTGRDTILEAALDYLKKARKSSK